MRTDRFSSLILLTAVLSLPAFVAAQEKPATESKTQKTTLELEKTKDAVKTQNGPVAQAAQVTQILDVEMTTIEGEKVNLKKYNGNVVLVVNVASKCGFTGQYKPLQSLHEKYSAKGLRVVAFPCNQFGNQEPKNEADINAFCKNKFGIKFDIFAKVDVKGKNQALLFKKLTKQKLGPVGSGDIRWNFEKFLIDKDGKPIARFASNVAPDSKVLVARIESALGLQKEAGVTKDPKQPDAKTSGPKSDAPKNKSQPAPAPKTPGLSAPDKSETPA